jgi:Arc/MetJ-type ribon-helix-helix transcriptional regulator
MAQVRKITVDVPEELLRRAQEATGEGITATIRSGLRLVAAREAYAALRDLRGRVAFSIDWRELREDR